MQIPQPATWGDILTYRLPSFPPVVRNEEKRCDPADYVDLFPLPTRPTYVLHNSSVVPSPPNGQFRTRLH